MKAVEKEAVFDFLRSEEEFYQLKDCIEENDNLLSDL